MAVECDVKGDCEFHQKGLCQSADKQDVVIVCSTRRKLREKGSRQEGEEQSQGDD